MSSGSSWRRWATGIGMRPRIRFINCFCEYWSGDACVRWARGAHHARSTPGKVYDTPLCRHLERTHRHHRDDTMTNTPDQSPLGKTSAYQTQYAPELLFPDSAPAKARRARPGRHPALLRRRHLECLRIVVAEHARQAAGGDRDHHGAGRFAEHRRIEVVQALPEFLQPDPPGEYRRPAGPAARRPVERLRRAGARGADPAGRLRQAQDGRAGRPAAGPPRCRDRQLQPGAGTAAANHDEARSRKPWCRTC
jgi:hypothetical protein